MKDWIVYILLVGLSQPVLGLNFSYRPIQPDQWEKVLGFIANKEYKSIVELGIQLHDETESEDIEKAEAIYFIALGLYHSKIYYGSYRLAQSIVLENIGTPIAEAALNLMDDLAQNYWVDDQEVQDALNRFSSWQMGPKAESFLQYFKARHLEQIGMMQWQKKARQAIDEESFWHIKSLYEKSLALVAAKNDQEAKKQLEELVSRENLSEKIRLRSNIQLARLAFSSGEYKRAVEIYESLKTNRREEGRINLEVAWAKYYEKDYSKALGILARLRSPYFRFSFSPEAYVLEMLIYKDLCYYGKVVEAAKEFKSRFDKTLGKIKNRSDYFNEPQIASMSLQDTRYQNTALYLEYLDNELETLPSLGYGDSGLLKQVTEYYGGKKASLKHRFQVELQKAAEVQAEKLLSFDEQITFLDYFAKLDALKMNREIAGHYQSKEISNFKFERIVWPTEKEFWRDELKPYQVLISSQCRRKPL